MSTSKAASILNQIIEYGIGESQRELIMQSDAYLPCLRLIESLLEKQHGKILEQNIALFGEMYATSDPTAFPNDILGELAEALKQANKSSPEKFEVACQNVAHFTKFAKVECYTSHFSMLSALLDERTCKPDGTFKNHNLTPEDIKDLGTRLSNIEPTSALLELVDTVTIGEIADANRCSETQFMDAVLTVLALIAESVKASKESKPAAEAAEIHRTRG